MSTLAHRRMTVDEFLAWAEGRQGRWELHNGVPYAMAAERMRHGRVKYRVQKTLEQAIRKAGVPCHMQPGGATVRISRHVAYEPDALVYYGPELADDALEVPNPVIVVEVASPSTRKFDDTVKRDDYFSLPSVQHYLIVDPDGLPVIHYSRRGDGTILKSPVHEGTLTLSPPGIETEVAELFAEPLG
jgi:Uma2 family endonuclease